MNDPIEAALPPPETEVLDTKNTRVFNEARISIENLHRDYTMNHGTLYRRDIRMNKAEKKAAKRRRHMLARKAHEVTA